MPLHDRKRMEHQKSFRTTTGLLSASSSTSFGEAGSGSVDPIIKSNEVDTDSGDLSV